MRDGPKCKWLVTIVTIRQDILTRLATKDFDLDARFKKKKETKAATEAPADKTTVFQVQNKNGQMVPPTKQPSSAAHRYKTNFKNSP